jgi:predicted transcriptional regulator
MKTVERDPREALRAFVAQYRTQTEAAAALGVSAVYVSDMLAGKRDPGAPILRRLGLRRAVVEDSAA